MISMTSQIGFWANEKCLKYKDNPYCGKCGMGARMGLFPQIGNRLKSMSSHFPQRGRAEKAFEINDSTNPHLGICGSCSSHKSHISGGIPRRGYPEMRVREPVLFVETRSTRASGSSTRMHSAFARERPCSEGGDLRFCGFWATEGAFVPRGSPIKCFPSLSLGDPRT